MLYKDTNIKSTRMIKITGIVIFRTTMILLILTKKEDLPI
jgi:hypothetical protein